MADTGLTTREVVPTSAPAAVTAPRRGRRRSALLLVPGLLVAALLFAAPLVRLVYSSVKTGDGYGLSAYTTLLGGSDIFVAVLLRTVGISAAVAAVTLVLGYPLAYLAVRLPPRLSAVLLVSVALPFFSSALVRTYAWQVILANNGPVNRLLLAGHLVDEPVQLVYNNIGVVIGTSQVLLPMMVFPLYSAMRNIDRSLQLAAQSLGASPFAAWRTVFLPLSSEGIFAGLSIVFISALGFYVTPVLLQGPSTPLLAQRIASQINIPGQRGNVAAQSTVVLVLAVALLYAFRRQLGLVLQDRDALPAAPRARNTARSRVRTGASAAVDGLLRGAADGRLGRLAEQGGRAVSAVRSPVLALLGLTGLLVLLAPLVVVFAVASSSSSFLRFPPPGWSTRWYDTYLHDGAWLDSTRLSLWVCAVAASIATLVGTLAAFAIVRGAHRRLSTFAYLLMVAPLVMPQVILAVGLYFTLAPTSLLGQPSALLLAYTVISLPVVVVVLTAVFRNLDPSYEQAAASLGASPARVARTIVAPLVRPAIVTALLFAFITGFDDLVMAQFLGGYNAETLVRRMYESIRFEVSPEVAAVGTLLIGAIVVVAAAFFLVTGRRPRAARPAPTTAT